MATVTKTSTKQFNGSGIASVVGPETVEAACISLDQLQSLRLDENKVLTMVRLTKSLTFAKTKGEGSIPGLVEQNNWSTAAAPGETAITTERKNFVSKFCSPNDGDDWIAPFGVIPLDRLLDFPAARSFKEYADSHTTVDREELGGAFLICASLVAIEAGNLEFNSICSAVAGQQFAKLRQGSTTDGSSAMSRTLQFSLQSKLQTLKDDTELVTASFSMVTWMLAAMFQNPAAYLKAIAEIGPLVDSFIQNGMPSGVTSIKAAATYVIENRLVTATERQAVQALLNTNCRGSLSIDGSPLVRHAQAVRLVKLRVSAHKNPSLFKKRKNGPEALAHMARSIPAFREENI